jgi:hypothetical protein
MRLMLVLLQALAVALVVVAVAAAAVMAAFRLPCATSEELVEEEEVEFTARHKQMSVKRMLSAFKSSKLL